MNESDTEKVTPAVKLHYLNQMKNICCWNFSSNFWHFFSLNSLHILMMNEACELKKNLSRFWKLSRGFTQNQSWNIFIFDLSAWKQLPETFALQSFDSRSFFLTHKSVLSPTTSYLWSTFNNYFFFDLNIIF